MGSFGQVVDRVAVKGRSDSTIWRTIRPRCAPEIHWPTDHVALFAMTPGHGFRQAIAIERAYHQ